MENIINKQETGITVKKTVKQRSVWKDLIFLLVKTASIALAFMLLFTFLFGIARYQDPSMAPAVRDGDLVIFYRHAKNGYLPQDAIALKKDGQMQVRRVVAVAGDTVDITPDGLVINGALQYEPEIYQKTERYEEGVDFPLTVPEGHIFVLGDSREGAADSRIYNSVKAGDTLGKVMTVIRRRSI
ncbi:MAG: signal peptidase I [Oscillospiraceae bacterium]|nr:signal peptidase I [Oscillospiraceae bacterium]